MFMKKVAIVNTLALIAFVSACVTQQDGGPATKSEGDTAKEIQMAVTTGCDYIPTITSILAILNVPGAPAADKIADKICTKVKAATKNEEGIPGGKLTVVVSGVKVQGVLKTK